MTENEGYLWDRRPQELCKKCGKCCRIVTTAKSYEELQKLAAEGDKGALDFLELFEPYESIEEAMLVDREQVEHIGYDENTTFYKCHFLQKNNLCSRYDTRKELCRHCPSTPFVILPPGCGFTEWIENEKLKIVKKVQDLKKERELYRLALLRGCDENKKIMLNKLITSIDNYINTYAKYGSLDW